MYYIASVSFGKDSLAMLLKLIELQYPLNEVVFYNTGMEFDAVYSIRDKVIPILDSLGIKFTELSPLSSFLYDMFERPVKYKNKPGYHYGYSWCGGRCRWGTTRKQASIKKHILTLNEKVTDYVGIAADEKNRIDRNRSNGKVLPLVDLGMTESDCLNFCQQNGYDWVEYRFGKPVRLYDVLDRVSCWCCSNKNLNELRNMYHFLPEYWDKLRDMQSRTERPMKSYGSLFEIEERFKKEDGKINGKDEKEC